MANSNPAKVKGARKAYRGVGSGATAEVNKLVESDPRFGQLAKALEGGPTEPSDAQRKFLDDFATDICKGTEGGDDTS